MALATFWAIIFWSSYEHLIQCCLSEHSNQVLQAHVSMVFTLGLALNHMPLKCRCAPIREVIEWGMSTNILEGSMPQNLGRPLPQIGTSFSPLPFPSWDLISYWTSRAIGNIRTHCDMWPSPNQSQLCRLFWPSGIMYSLCKQLWIRRLSIWVLKSKLTMCKYYKRSEWIISFYNDYTSYWGKLPLVDHYDNEN